MYKFQIPNMHDNFWTNIQFSLPNKNCVTILNISGQSCYFLSLSEQIHNWLMDNQIEYELQLINDDLFILFNNKNDAVLFKLALG